MNTSTLDYHIALFYLRCKRHFLSLVIFEGYCHLPQHYASPYSTPSSLLKLTHGQGLVAGLHWNLPAREQSSLEKPSENCSVHRHMANTCTCTLCFSALATIITERANAVTNHAKGKQICGELGGILRFQYWVVTYQEK